MNGVQRNILAQFSLSGLVDDSWSPVCQRLDFQWSIMSIMSCHRRVVEVSAYIFYGDCECGDGAMLGQILTLEEGRGQNFGHFALLQEDILLEAQHNPKKREPERVHH